jgi:hypothetical protein
LEEEKRNEFQNEEKSNHINRKRGWTTMKAKTMTMTETVKKTTMMTLKVGWCRKGWPAI